MLSFVTEFPVDAARTPDEFIRAVSGWLLASPHSALTASDLENLGREGAWTVSKTNERVESLRGGREGYECASIRYKKADGELEWTTTVTFSRGRDAWVAVRIFCESIHPAVRLPPAKKPLIVKVLMEQLGGGDDGELQVQPGPLTLTNFDVDKAARLMLDGSGCRLPIVYVSSTFRDTHILDPVRLARAVAGMAHVVVEPNRAFSVRLKLEANSQNVYGGAVGVYWPDGGGRRSFFMGRGMAFERPEEMQEAICGELTAALANRRPLFRCTWASAQELVSRDTFERLKNSGSVELDEYIATFDRELASKQEELDDAEREIARLKAELRIHEARAPQSAGISLATGQEVDLLPGEIRGVVLDALSDALGRITTDSRRSHVIQAVLKSTQNDSEAAMLREQVKDLLRGYESMDQKTRRGLERLGFVLTEEGKHHKLVFQGDDRYTFVLPKSGSDQRGGLNAAGDIGRLLF